ncbi:MAG: PAS domain S-box protein [Nitrospinae bacterium]|nr:PAS domain S-box protein [Nitrospinota bacterium]
MLVFIILPPLNPVLEMLLDAGMVTIFTFPVIYLFVYTPMDRNIAELKKAEARMREFSGELEKKVGERTEDLKWEVLERTRAEEDARKSKVRLELIVETIAEGIYIVNDDGRIVFANSASEKMFGMPRENLYARSYNDKRWKVFKPTGEPLSKGDYPFEIVKATGKPVYGIEIAAVRPEGIMAIIQINAVPLKDSSGKFLGMVASQRDITEMKLANESLRESEKKYKALIDGASDAILIALPDGRIQEANRRAEALFGYTDSELRGMDFNILAPPGKLEGLTEAFRRLVTEGGTIFLHDSSILRKDGKEIPVDISGSAVEYSGKRIIQGLFRDMTQQRLAEESLRQAHRENEQLIAAMPSIFIGVDELDVIKRWNTEAEIAFNIGADAALGGPFVNTRIQWDWPEILQYICMSRDSERTIRAHDIKYMRKDGKNGFLDMTFTPIFGERGKWNGFLVLAADITERKVMESVFSQAQKLEAIGQLAAGIAHEINTPIQYVGDNLRFLEDAFREIDHLICEYAMVSDSAAEGRVSPESAKLAASLAQSMDVNFLREEIPRAVAQSLDGVGRVATIVRAMKDFSHPGVEGKTAVDINKAIESTVTVSRNEWKYVADVVTQFDQELPLAPVVAGEFNQVILNLIVNAAHAIADVVGDGSRSKGTITIGTRKLDNGVEIQLADTGAGIPESIRHKIFDPFFTTKEVGKGTGQGLALARSVIVDKHGGSISFDSEPGKGTVFTIWLPLENAGKGHVQ